MNGTFNQGNSAKPCVNYIRSNPLCLHRIMVGGCCEKMEVVHGRTCQGHLTSDSTTEARSLQRLFQFHPQVVGLLNLELMIGSVLDWKMTVMRGSEKRRGKV